MITFLQDQSASRISEKRLGMDTEFSFIHYFWPVM